MNIVTFVLDRFTITTDIVTNTVEKDTNRLDRSPKMKSIFHSGISLSRKNSREVEKFTVTLDIITFAEEMFINELDITIMTTAFITI
jgi:hypothetical protein